MAAVALVSANASFGAAKAIQERSSGPRKNTLTIIGRSRQKLEPVSRKRCDRVPLPLPFPVAPLKSTLAAVLGALLLPGGARADVDDVLASLDNGLEGTSLFVQENPLVVAGGLAAVLVPTLVISLFAGKGYAGDVSPEDALKLLEQPNSLLLDIRGKAEKAAEGSPSLKSVKKKPKTVAFEIEEDDAIYQDPAFADKVAALQGASPETVVVVLGGSGGLAATAASVLAKADFSKVYVVKGGAESWKESGLQWDEPGRPFKVDLGVFKDALGSVEGPKLPASTLGVAAAAGVSVLLLSELETALQLLGSAAILQLFVKKFLFAEDRKTSFSQIQTFLDTKIAPEALVDDIKQIGNVLLKEGQAVTGGADDAFSGKGDGAAAEAKGALSAVAAEASSAAREVSGQVSSAAAEATNAVAKATEGAASSTEEASGGPGAASTTAEGSGGSTSSSTDLPPSSRPLSPYAQFPDLKPPSSPTPSPP